MWRRFTVLVLAAIACAIAGLTQAATFEPAASKISIALGATNAPGANAEDQGGAGTVTLISNGMGGHDVAMESSVWNTANFGSGTSLFTGIPVIDDIRVTARNDPGTFTSSFTQVNYLETPNTVVGPYLGGIARLNGSMVLWILNNPALAFDLYHVGGPGGGTSRQTLGGIPFTVTAGPWFTGPVPLTGITTNILSFNGVTGAGISLRLTPNQHGKVLSTGGGFVSINGGLPLEAHTVTLQGDNQLLSAAPSVSGAVTLVSPMRVNTSPSISGRVAGAIWMDLSFVPEPGTVLLLATGALGLVAVGRWRLRK